MTTLSSCNIIQRLALTDFFHSLQDIAAKLAIEGPVKQEPSKRRVRGLVGGEWVFDTLGAFYVWEHPYCILAPVPLLKSRCYPNI